MFAEISRQGIRLRRAGSRASCDDQLAEKASKACGVVEDARARFALRLAPDPTVAADGAFAEDSRRPEASRTWFRAPGRMSTEDGKRHFHARHSSSAPNSSSASTPCRSQWIPGLLSAASSRCKRRGVRMQGARASRHRPAPRWRRSLARGGARTDPAASHPRSKLRLPGTWWPSLSAPRISAGLVSRVSAPGHQPVGSPRIGARCTVQPRRSRFSAGARLRHRRVRRKRPCVGNRARAQASSACAVSSQGG